MPVAVAVCCVAPSVATTRRWSKNKLKAVSPERKKFCFNEHVVCYPRPLSSKGELSRVRHHANKPGYRHEHRSDAEAQADDLRCALARALHLAQEVTRYVPSKATGAACPKARKVGSPACSSPSRWICDAGSGFDLIGKPEVPADYVKRHGRSADLSFTLHTANGPIQVDQEVALQVGPLYEEVWPYLLDNTPAVLSVGRRCMKGGYKFVWNPYKDPYLVAPDGRTIMLQVDNYVPYLPDASTALPSVAGIHTAPSVRMAGAKVDAGDKSSKELDLPDDMMLSELLPKGDAGGSAEAPPPKGRVGERDLVAEATSLHHLMTHMPKNPHCPSWQRAKMQRKSARRKVRKYPPDGE